VKVSVIIPCYNNAAFIEAAIDSALDQTYKDIEVIVINDGSTDSSAQKIKAYGDRIISIDQQNLGACAARNAGLAVASGKWIKFLDGDDWLYQNCIEDQINWASDSNIIQFGYPTIVNEKGDRLIERGHIHENTFCPGKYAELANFLEFPILISTTLYPTIILRSVGGFDPSVRRGQEHELHLRLFLSGYEFRFAPVNCFAYRQHQTKSRISVSRRTESYFANVDNFERLVEFARDGPRSKTFECNRYSLARSAWRIGRRKIRDSADIEAAREFFRIAKSLGGRDAIYGRPLYKAVVRVLDPVFVEKLLACMRSHPFKGTRK
jgi:glycosyltransferase involved in cell wall biosynthesis